MDKKKINEYSFFLKRYSEVKLQNNKVCLGWAMQNQTRNLPAVLKIRALTINQLIDNDQIIVENRLLFFVTYNINLFPKKMLTS